MDSNQRKLNLVLGSLLIAGGALWLAGHFLDWLNWGTLWPVFIIAVGGFFWLGLLFGGKSVSGLAYPAAIITTIGLILFVQNVLGWWETWTYAWGLSIAAVGLGMFIQGVMIGQDDLKKSGVGLAQLGLYLFIIFGAFFEMIFSIGGASGRGGRFLWPVLILLLGLYLLVRRTIQVARGTASGDQRDLFFPVLLTGGGLYFLLANLDVITTWQWTALLNLWPLLLIAGGLQLIIGRRSPWIGAVIGLLVVATIFGLTLFASQATFSNFPGLVIHSGEGGNWLAQETVRGSGEAVSETRQMSNFNKISLSAVGILEIVQGEKTGLVIEAEENLLPHLTSRISGGQLELGVERGYNLQPTQPIRYFLTVTNLQAIVVSGAGNVTSNLLQVGDLYLEASGASSFDLANLRVDKLEIEISGTGSANVSGSAREVDVDISGAGDYQGGDLAAPEVEITISGLGKAETWSTETLDVTISGAGSVAYYGIPAVRQNISGAGTITSLGER